RARACGRMARVELSPYESPAMPRLQFRLRSLFILTAVVAVGCLVVSWGIKEHQRRLEIKQLRSILSIAREGCVEIGKEQKILAAIRRLRELGVQDDGDRP